jgi:hypothetical protein
MAWQASPAPSGLTAPWQKQPIISGFRLQWYPKFFRALINHAIVSEKEVAAGTFFIIVYFCSGKTAPEYRLAQRSLRRGLVDSRPENMSEESTCIPGPWQGMKEPSALDNGMKLPENPNIEEYHENLSKRTVVQCPVPAGVHQYHPGCAAVH